MALRRGHRGLRPLPVGLCALGALAASTATNSPGQEEIPALRPPHSEIPPGFWEQYGWLCVLLGVVVVALVGIVIWLLTRPKAPAVVPPELEARRALEPLYDRPEDGLLLSRVSQVLRRYVATAFGLPAGELTTTEFGRAVAERVQIGPELAAALTDFLRQCDQRKFSPPAPAPPLSAVAYALKLIDQAQARRSALAEGSQPHGSSNANAPQAS